LLAFICILNSCENEDTILKSKDNLLSETEIKDIGIKHNEALAFVLKELQKHPDLNKEQKAMKASMATKKFLRSIYPENDQVIAAAKEEEYRVYERFTNSKVKKAGSPIISGLDENNESFSEKQRKLLLECDNILSIDGLNLQEILEGLNRIQQKAKDLPVEEQSVILAAAEVGKQSATYWSENLVAWDEALNGTGNKRTKGWFSFGDVVKADVEGAVGGAIYAGVLNVIPGAGQVAYGGSILAGAAGNSGISAVSQLLDHCFYPGEGAAVTYFTSNPEYLRMTEVKDRKLISKAKGIDIDITDNDDVLLYFDSNNTLSWVSTRDIVNLYAYKQLQDSYSYVTIPLGNLDRSYAVARYFVGTTPSSNVSTVQEEFNPEDGDFGSKIE